MNPEEIVRLQRGFEDLKVKVSDLHSKIRGLEINEQLYLRSNTPIAPGIGCKFAYDMNGLILRSEPLSETDIPDLQVDKILGLRKLINEKVSKYEIERLRVEMKDISVRKGPVAGTGTKVNYDANGLVVSVSDLLPSDIPMLPIEKIDGLKDIIENLRGLHSKEDVSAYTHAKISPGTYCKITYSEDGHVIKGERLSIDDIPNDLISRLNLLETSLTRYAPQQIVDGLSSAVVGKLDANTPIKPGVYTKVTVDEKGLVTFGDKLTISDLPEITIKNIPGLDRSLADKADREEFLRVSETVSSMSSSLAKLNELLTLKTMISTKADATTVRNLEAEISGAKKILTNLLNNTPLDAMNQLISTYDKQMSSVEGRLASIEKSLGLSPV